MATGSQVVNSSFFLYSGELSVPCRFPIPEISTNQEFNLIENLCQSEDFSILIKGSDARVQKIYLDTPKTRKDWRVTIFKDGTISVLPVYPPDPILFGRMIFNGFDKISCNRVTLDRVPEDRIVFEKKYTEIFNKTRHHLVNITVDRGEEDFFARRFINYGYVVIDKWDAIMEAFENAKEELNLNFDFL